jgi:hypothetical protein
MDTTREPLLLDRWSLAQWENMVIPASFIWITLIAEAFKYDDGAKFCGYVGTNAEPLCIKLCNFALCHIFVNYLIC